jgi:AcrR family transcriptional regulator
VTLSAKGTRLNRRGLETRSQILDVAVGLLAAGGHEVVSANLIARAAGVTWGTIQHQFGDTDGVWAAVLDHAAERSDAGLRAVTEAGASIDQRVRSIVHAMWDAYDEPTVLAVMRLRATLPHDPDVLAAQFPSTFAALRRWEAAWTRSWDSFFHGLVRSPVKLRRVRSLLPGAVRGLRAELQLATFEDVDEGRRGLVDAVTLYLRTPAAKSTSSVG